MSSNVVMASRRLSSVVYQDCADDGHVGSSPMKKCSMHFYCIKSNTDELFDDC